MVALIEGWAGFAPIVAILMIVWSFMAHLAAVSKRLNLATWATQKSAAPAALVR